MNDWRVLDLFSGIGGFSLGLERAGMRTVAFCENNEFCREVLAKHWPGTPILGDITTVEFPEADVVVGGFPCQDVSCAGKRAGLSGERSGLYRELVRALRVVRPRHAIVENVAALLNDGMGIVCGDVATSGFDLEWDCIPACALGAPHERDRVYIVAHANGFDWWTGAGWQDGPQVGDSFEAPAASDATYPHNERCGEARSIRHQPEQVSTRRITSWATTGNASDIALVLGTNGTAKRPPDSFAGIREEASKNASDPYSARLAFRSGLTRDAWEKLTPTERDVLSDGGQSIWPNEPALSGVDDVIPDWVDRTKATGNTIIPLIPQIIGKTLIETEGLTS